MSISVAELQLFFWTIFQICSCIFPAARDHLTSNEQLWIGGSGNVKAQYPNDVTLI